jgi:serine/threonine protein kinase/tetratricopeptide (TPR) repeat protein
MDGLTAPTESTSCWRPPVGEHTFTKHPQTRPTVSDVTVSALGDALRSHYTIERELGRGGMATVYLARDLRHDRLVAFKVLRPELAAALGPERFLREIRLTARLQHPHILTVLDSGETVGRLWFTMPFVDGESLRSLLARERQLPIPEALRIARDACEALDFAHQHGIIHRDVKPENLLLTTDRSTLVADFGLARSCIEAARDLTEAGLAVGTPAYMSPEQASGAADPDPRTDIYSLGCVLYEMLTGDPPFSGRSPAAIVARKMVEPAPPIRVVRDSVPEAVEAVVMQSLARVAADRFPTMRAFAEALDAAGRGASAGGKPLRSRSGGRSAVFAGLLLAIGVVSGVMLRKHNSPDVQVVRNRVVVGLFENRTGDPSLDPLGSMAADWLTDGILRSGVAEVVPTTATLLVMRGSRDKADSAAGPPDLRELVQETGAGRVISGSYYRVRDSLQFRVRLLDPIRGKVLQVISPTTGPQDRPLEAIDLLRQRVVGALAVELDTALASGWLGLLTSPPTYEAYKAYLEALRLFGQLRFAEGIPYLDSALVTDSTFGSALLLKAWAHANIGDIARFDSVIAILERRRLRLSPAEDYELEWLVAVRRGDLAAARRALVRQAALSPDPAARGGAAVFALRINHPRAALNDLAPGDRESLVWRTVPWTWETPTEAYHLLGEHARELEEAEHGRAEHRDLTVNLHYEVLARASLGQVQRVHLLLDEASRLTPQPIWAFGPIAATAALELRAHGYPDSARRVMGRAVDWYRGQFAEDSLQSDNGYGLARCLYWAGEWVEARKQLAALVARIPAQGLPWHGVGTAADYDYYGLLGTLAARQGERKDAELMLKRLETMKGSSLFRSQPTLWQARIHALLGNREAAVSLLRDAISHGLMPLDMTQGLGYAMWLHRDVDFESLLKYQPYLELLRPTD